MISILDYGAGNLRSVQNTLGAIGAEYELVRDADGLAARDEDHSAGRRPLRPDDARARCRCRFATRCSSGSARAFRFSESVWACRRCFESSEEAPEERGLGIYSRRRSGGFRRRARSAHGLERARAACRRRSCCAILATHPYRLFRAQLLCSGDRRDGGDLRLHAALHGGARTRTTFAACSFIPRSRAPLGLQIVRNFVEL